MSRLSKTKKERVILSTLVGLLLVLIVFFVGLLMQNYREYKHLKDRETRFEARLIQARKEFDHKEAYLTRMLEDPEFLERVVRERLGYARPDEVLFRFSED